MTSNSPGHRASASVGGSGRPGGLVPGAGMPPAPGVRAVLPGPGPHPHTHTAQADADPTHPEPPPRTRGRGGAVRRPPLPVTRRSARAAGLPVAGPSQRPDHGSVDLLHSLCRMDRAGGDGPALAVSDPVRRQLGARLVQPVIAPATPALGEMAPRPAGTGGHRGPVIRTDTPGGFTQGRGIRDGVMSVHAATVGDQGPEGVFTSAPSAGSRGALGPLAPDVCGPPPQLHPGRRAPALRSGPERMPLDPDVGSVTAPGGQREHSTDLELLTE